MGAVLTALVLVLGLWFQAPATHADDIVVMTSGAFAAADEALAPVYERASHGRIVTATTTSGVGAESIANRLLRHEPADVIIVPAQNLEALIKAGSVIAESRTDLARSSIAAAVRAGAQKPDIGSVDALKRTLLAAHSVAYSASVSGDYLVNELFPRLGIAEQMKGRSRRIERERVAAVVARGDAELGFQQLSELLPVPGIQIVGLLPADVQRVTIVAAGIAAHSTHPDAARAYIRFLASAAAAHAIETSGMEPLRTGKR